MKRVEVSWEDSTIPHRGWQTKADVKADRGSVRCTSIGFVLHDDKRGIVLAGSVHGTEAAGVVHIPRGAVRKVRRLR